MVSFAFCVFCFEFSGCWFGVFWMVLTGWRGWVCGWWVLDLDLGVCGVGCVWVGGVGLVFF